MGLDRVLHLFRLAKAEPRKKASASGSLTRSQSSQIHRIFAVFVALYAMSANSLLAERPVRIDPSFSPVEKLKADVEYLASESLRGRGVADETIHTAANYVARRFRESGLKTGIVDGSAFQPLMIPVGARVRDADRNFVRFNRVDTTDDDATNNTEQRAQIGVAMNPMSIGATSGNVKGELVFAGYGITAPKLAYDDYATIDAKGKIVVILRKEPGATDPKSPFDGTKTSQHAFFETKIRNAVKHGAVAIIFVNDIGSVSKSIVMAEKNLQREQERKTAIERRLASLPIEAVHSRSKLENQIELVQSSLSALEKELIASQRGVLGIGEAGGLPFTRDKKEKIKPIPVVSVARDFLDNALQRSIGDSLPSLENRIDHTYRPSSVEFDGLTASVSVDLQPSRVSTSNVLGEITGQGALSDQTVVIGAHYDHVGMGGYGSLAPGTIAVHNGADDNASGTAAMFAIAELLSHRLASESSHRRVMFIAFTGEERGLVGSKHYTKHPIYPLDSTVAMINMDMVGRLRDNELTVYGTGSADTFDSVIDRANAKHQFDLVKIPTGYGPSDHQSFYQAGVPVLFFFTGLHNDYHRPSDDSDKIDYGGLTRITDIVCDVALDLASRKPRPIYAQTDKRVQIRRQLTAFLGISMNNRGNHIVISGISPGSPAQRAGLMIGDRLDRLGKKSIRTSDDVLETLRSFSPGDLTKVSIDRYGQTVEISVRLGSRPGD